MQIDAEFFAIFRDAAGTHRLQVDLPEGTNLVQLLDTLLAQRGPALQRMIFDANGRLNPAAIILINGRSLPQGAGLNLPLADGDTVSFLVRIAGGMLQCHDSAGVTS